MKKQNQGNQDESKMSKNIACLLNFYLYFALKTSLHHPLSPPSSSATPPPPPLPPSSPTCHPPSG